MLSNVGDMLVGQAVGQVVNLRPIGNRPTAALALESGGSQPPRSLPSCPTLLGAEKPLQLNRASANAQAPIATALLVPSRLMPMAVRA